MATDLFVLVVCAGLSANHGCSVSSEAGYYSHLQCDEAKRSLTVYNPPPSYPAPGARETDNRWTTFAYCRPGTPAEVRRWEREGLGPQAGVLRERR
jgi:hypothetical protein